MALMEKVIAGVQSHGFALQIAAYPKELKHLVTMYRYCFGCSFSFSGVIFTEIKREGGNDRHNIFNFLLSIFFILANATVIILFLVPFTVIPMYFSPSRMDEPMKLTDFINIARYNTEFDDIKPLLRLIMQSIMYVFIVEMIANNGANLLYGGRLVAELAELANSLQDDKEEKEKQQPSTNIVNFRWTIGRVIAIKLAVLCSLTTVSLLLFNRSRLVLLFQCLLEPDRKLTMQQRNELLKMVFLSAWHFRDYLTHLMWPTFFLYTMTLFSRHVRHIRASIEEVEGEKGGLEECRLEEVTEQLSALAVHFRRILAYFSLPLSTMLTLSVLSIIGSCCFLSHQSSQQTSEQPQQQHYYVSTIFSFGVYALLRLVLIAWTSSLPDREVRELIRVVHSRSSPTTTAEQQPWSSNGWLVFGELRSLRARFTVSFLDDCLSIRQSTVLSMLGFALQYTVVLLQTNDYQSPVQISGDGGDGGGSGRNATLD